jgi:sigma-B regulation protein RsbU (phosphoserine phosphatase)
LYLTDNSSYVNILKELRFERLDFLQKDATLGAIISKTATILRVRKMIVSEKSTKQDVFDLNAHLRDLTEKHKREIEEARQIQENLLPKELPQGEGYEIEVCYIPLEDLGGDYYDIRKNPDNSITMLVADATGHGLPAAFISSMTKMAIVAVSKEHPNELFAGMNQLMTPQMPPGRFITMAAISYDPSSGKLSSARAGHPPVIIFRRNQGSAIELKAGGFAIGFMSDSEYSSEDCALESGDIAVLYTDGITEAQNRNLELFGSKRVIEALTASSSEMSAKQVLTSIVAKFKEFTEGRILKDDVTMIVLKKL